MRRKYKITGCARFFIFLLIFTPLVLVGVSVYNGNNPINQVKDLLGIETDAVTTTPATTTSPSKSTPTKSTSVSNEAIYKGTIETQKSTIEELRKEVRDLEKAVKDRDREIQFLKQSGNE